MSAGDFITTDVYGTFVLLEAARAAPHLRRFVQISTDEVYGSVPTGASRETDELQAAEPVLGEQGRRRSAGLQLLGDLRRAGDRHARVEQLRAVPVSREGHPALRHQRDRRHPGAALRRRPATSATGCTCAITAARVDLLIDAGTSRRGLQHRRRQRGHERRPHAPHPRRWSASRESLIRPVPIAPATTAATRSTRRSCARSAGRRRWRSTRACARPSSGTGRTSGGGGRSRRAIPRSAPTTTRSTARAASDVSRAWSSSRHRRHGFRRQPPPRSSARRRARGRRVVASCAAATRAGRRRRESGGTPSICSIARRSRSASPNCGHRSIYHCAGDRACRRGVAEAGRARCRSTCSARITCSKQCATPGSTCPCSSPARRSSTGRRRAADARTIRSARRIRTASASWRRRCSPTRPATRPSSSSGRSITPDRGSRRSYVTSSFARQIAEIEAGHARAGASRRQPRRAPRHHRRPRHGARIPARRSARAARASLQRLLGCGLSGARSARCAGGHVGRPIAVTSIPARFRPSDNPVITGNRSRIGAEAGWEPRIPIERTLEDLLDYWRERTRTSTPS